MLKPGGQTNTRILQPGSWGWFKARPEITLSLALSVLVAIPAFFSRPWADDVFMLYMPEFFAGNNPFRLAPQVISEIPKYLDLGVFRFFSRLILYIENWLVLRVSVFNGIPVTVLKAGVRILLLCSLLTSLSLFLRQALYFSNNNTKNCRAFLNCYALFFPIIFSSLFVLSYPGQNPVTLTPSLYLVPACLVFLVPYLVLRYSNTQFGALRSTQLVGFGVIGAAIASMMETAYLAIPVAAAYSLSYYFLFSNGSQRREKFLDCQYNQNVIAIALGFFFIFAPIRYIIHNTCQLGQCYKAATIELDSDLFSVGAARLVAPAVTYFEALIKIITSRFDISQSEITTVAILLILEFLIVLNFVRSSSSEKGTDKVGYRAILLIVIPMVVALVGAATMAGLSAGLQEREVLFASWRDTAITWPVLCVLFACMMFLALRTIHSGTLHMIMIGILMLTPIPTFFYNHRAFEKISASPVTRIHLSLGNHLVYFDKSESATEERCKLIKELSSIVRDDETRSIANEISEYINVAAKHFHKTPYCK